MPQPLNTHLTALESSGLIRSAEAEAELEYIFRHALIQSAAYESLLKADRRRLHSTVAEAIELTYADQLTEIAPTLAQHFLLAENAPRALHYFTLAAEAELRRFANAEAEAHFRAALQLAPEANLRARLLAGLGEALFRQSKFVAADDVWRQAIESHAQINDYAGVARMYARAARNAGTTYGSDAARGLALCREGLQAMAHQPETPALAVLLHETSRACYFSGLLEEAKTYGEQALALAEKLDDKETQAETLATLWGLLPAAEPEAAFAGLQRAAQLAEATGRWDIAARCYHNMGFRLGIVAGELQKGRAHVYQAIEFFRRQGDEAGQFYSLDVASLFSFLLGELEEVERILQWMHRLLHSAGNPQLARLSLRGWEAWLLRCRGEAQKALEIYAGVRAGFRQHEHLDTLGNMNCTFAELALEINDLALAEDLVQEAVAIAERGLMERVEPLSLQAALYARRGQLEAARRTLAEAQAIAQAEPSLFNTLLSTVAEARLAVAESDWPRALAAFSAAHTFATQHHIRWQAAQLLREWAEACLAAGEANRARELLRQAQTEFEVLNVPKYAALMRERVVSLSSDLGGERVSPEKS